MIIIPVKNPSSLEQALKAYKFKVFKTKQLEKLKNNKEFVKPSQRRRSIKNKAKYNQSKKNSN